MKKWLSFLVVLTLLVGVTSAYAATGSAASETTKPAFDVNVLKNCPYYNYDKFSKEWNVQAQYVREYRDVKISIALLLFDDYAEKGWGPELRIKFFDKDANHYDKVTGIRVLVDDTLYSFDLQQGTNCGFAYGGSVMRDLFNSLNSANEVAIQIDHTDTYGSSWTGTIDPVDLTALNDVILLSQFLEASYLWDNTADYSINDILYGASKE